MAQTTKKVTIHLSEKGSGFLFDHGDGTVYLLNATGMYIFDLLGQGMSLIDITDKVSREFSVEKTMIAKEIEEFVAELETLGILG